jgi:hypothetical protein
LAQNLGRQDCPSFAECSLCQPLFFFEGAAQLLPLLVDCVECTFSRDRGNSTADPFTTRKQELSSAASSTPSSTTSAASLPTLQPTKDQDQDGGGQDGGGVSPEYEACKDQCSSEINWCTVFLPCRTGLTCAVNYWAYTQQSCDQG